MRQKNAIRRAVVLLKQHLPAYLSTVLLFSAVDVTMELATATAMRKLFDAVAVQNPAMLWAVVQALGIMLALFIVPFPFAYYRMRKVAAEMSATLRKRVFDHVQALPLSFFQSQHSGDLVSRLTNDINAFETAYTNTLVHLSLQLLGGLGALVYIVWLDWRMAIFSALIGLLGSGINVASARPLRTLGGQVQLQLAAVTMRLADLLAGMQVVRIFGLRDIVLRSFGQENEALYAAARKRVIIRSGLDAANTCIGLLSFAGLAVLGSYLAAQGVLAVGTIIAVTQLQGSVTHLFQSLGQTVAELQSSLAGADRICEVLDQPREPLRHQGPSRDLAMTPYIGFRDIHFTYGQEKVLDGLTLSLQRGQVAALVGPSGAGKSTILRLLLGFYRPAAGEIYVNHSSISGLELTKLRHLLAYVPQDNYLFTGTIAENIAYGKTGASMDEVIAAAKAANAYDFIMQLECGFETSVGERGGQLSGGERQRIAIARALLKDTPILLLDEATAALDTESEHLVQQALERLMHGRTTIVIAHRLSTIRKADIIFVVDGGRIVESGKHEELIALHGGLYQLLYERSKGQPVRTDVATIQPLAARA